MRAYCDLVFDVVLVKGLAVPLYQCVGHFCSLVKFPSVQFILQFLGVKPGLYVLLDLPLNRLRIIHGDHPRALESSLLLISGSPSHKFLLLYFDPLLLRLLNVLVLLLQEIALIWILQMGRWKKAQCRLWLRNLIVHREPRAKDLSEALKLRRSYRLEDILRVLLVINFDLLLFGRFLGFLLIILADFAQLLLWV